MFKAMAFVLSFIVISAAARAQSTDRIAAEIRQPSDIRRGTLALLYDGRIVDAPLLESEFDVTVNGIISRTRVKQRFRNMTNEWVEGLYIYPLPETAVVDHMTLSIGDRRIDAEIRERAAAEKAYQQAQSEGRRASLVKQERPNIYTTSVANIRPSSEIEVEIEYQQTLSYDAGEISLRIPLVVGPRYRPTTLVSEALDPNARDAERQPLENPSLPVPPLRGPGAAPGNPVSIRVRLEPGFPVDAIRSLYHSVEQHALGQDAYTIELDSDTVPADRDFVLSWQVEPGALPRAAAFRETVAGTQYALLMLVPPEDTSDTVLPRDLVFAIDTSGSMDGTSIDQARDALVFALGRLRPTDRFNVIRFATATELLFPEPLGATPENLGAAIRYVRALESRGGTEMYPAVQAALRQFQGTRSQRVRQIVFITDGNVANEDVLFDLIERSLGDARLFTVGIGSAPNSYFMTGAARYGRGIHTYIGEVSEVAERMSGLFRKIERPVLSGVEIDWPRTAGRDVYPERIGDLFAGDPLLVSVRGELPTDLTVSGSIAGAQWSETIPVRGTAAVGVAVNWARSRIDHLLDQRHERQPGDPTYDAVVATALEHHQVSRYTSLVAVDSEPVRAPEERALSATVPINLPAGWRYAGLIGRLPAGATGAPFDLLIAVILSSLALGLIGVSRWRSS